MKLNWQLPLRNFATMPGDSFFSGRSCHAPLVRDGKFWIIRPEGSQIATGSRMTPATVAIHSVTDGSEISRYTSPIDRSTFQFSYASQDTDLVCGVFWAFVPGNRIYAASGGDFPGRWCFNADTGASEVLPGLGATVIGSGTNCAASFSAHPDVPFIISGGNNNHWHLSANGSIHNLTTGKANPWVGFKQWCDQLASPATQSSLRVDDIARTSAACGTRLWGISAIHGGIGAEIPGKIVCGSLGHNGTGYPRPVTLLSNGEVAMLCVDAVFAASTTNYSAPVANGAVELIVISPTLNGKTGMIPMFTAWKQLGESYRVSIPTTSRVHPKLTACDSHIVGMFSPSDSSTQAYLFAVDRTGKRLVWGRDLPLSLFSCRIQRYAFNNFPRHNNITMQVIGNEIVMAEAIAATQSPGIVLRIIRFDLATGTHIASESFPLAIDHTGINASFVTIRDSQVIGDSLLVTAMYRTSSATHQVMAFVSASTTPAGPVLTVGEQETLDYAKPRLSATKYAAVKQVIEMGVSEIVGMP